MESTPLWFPHISDQILDPLDNQSLVKCRCLNKSWKIFIDKAKLVWNEIINMHNENTDDWKMILQTFQESHGIISKYYKVEVDSQIREWNEGRVPLNPLHIAALTGQTDMFINILKNKKIKNKNPEDSYKTTPLHIAAGKGYLEICQMIIESLEHKHEKIKQIHIYGYGFGVNQIAPRDLTLEILSLNPRNAFFITPLHMAAKKGHYLICKLILDNIDPEKADSDDHGSKTATPFRLAAESEHWNVCRLFIEFKAYYSMDDLVFAINVSAPLDPEIMEMAVKILVDKRQMSKIIEYRVRNNKNIKHFCNDSGKMTISHLVAENLFQNENTPYTKMRNLLHYATEFVDVKLHQNMLKYVTNKNPKNLFGITPLHKAADLGNFMKCKLIIDNIEEKNPAAKNKITPLHIAAKKGHLKVCKLIVENISNKNPLDANGNRPLDLLNPTKKEYAELVTLFKN